MNITKALLGLLAAVSLTARAEITISTGNPDPNAPLRGAVRFRALSNSPSQQSVYLATSPGAMGSSDRAQMDVTRNSGAKFTFGWDPLRNKLFTEVETAANGTQRIEQNFSIPCAGLLPNFILVSGKDSAPFNQLMMTFGNFNGDPVTRNVAAGAEFSQISISDLMLLKRGSILRGAIFYSGTPNSNESDKFEITSGHSDMVAVPEASNYIAAAMLVIPVLVRLHRTLRPGKRSWKASGK